MCAGRYSIHIDSHIPSWCPLRTACKFVNVCSISCVMPQARGGSQHAAQHPSQSCHTTSSRTFCSMHLQQTSPVLPARAKRCGVLREARGCGGGYTAPGGERFEGGRRRLWELPSGRFDSHLPQHDSQQHCFLFRVRCLHPFSGYLDGIPQKYE